MKKKYSIEDIESSQEPVIEEGKKAEKTSDKTPVNFKRKKKRKVKRIVITSIIVILLAAIGYFGFIGWNSLNKIFSGGGAPSLLNLFNQQQLKGESSGRVNILLLGVGDKGHSGDTLSDTIMVVSYDVKTKNVAMISIPRDLYVKIGDYGYAKINAAHAYGEMYKYNGGGPALAEDTVSKVLDLPIHYYARVDFTGFKKIIDAVGGVDINVEKDLYDPYYPTEGDKSIMAVSFKKGMQHMDGTKALQYARSRETTSDFDRARRQQQVIVAARSKVLSSSTLLNPKKISDIIQILGDHVKTDFQLGEAQRAIELFKGVDTSKIVNRVFDNGGEGLLVSQSSYETGYILVPRLGQNNYRELQDVAKNIFKDNSMKNEAATVSVLNGSTKSGVASRFAEKLKNEGINVNYIGTADRTNYNGTIITDNTGGKKSSTINYLKDLLNATVVTGHDTSSDIEIVLGKDYQE